MRRCFYAVTLLVFCAGMLLPSVASANGTTRVVDDDGLASVFDCNAATPTFNLIQPAVNASSSGDTILVCPGTYVEQVKIVTKNLTIRGIASGNENLAVIKPLGAVVNSTSAFSGADIAGIVVVEGSTNVTLINLAMDGANNLLPSCAVNLVGIFYRNASGKVDSAAVRNIRLGAGLEGCQSGVGIFAQSGTGGVGAPGLPSKLTVTGTSVHDYQKTGIAANEPGTELYASLNGVSGIGPTPFIAQNGIQIAFGGKGTIINNSVANHAWTGCVDLGNCPFTSSNILVFDAGVVKVTTNSLAKSQVNIYLGASNSEVTTNMVIDSDVFDGIAVVGDKNKILSNVIMNSDEAGVYVQGNLNKVQQNTINEAACGILEDVPSSGNILTPNSFFNTQAKTCTPVVVFAALSAESAPAGPDLPPTQPVR